MYPATVTFVLSKMFSRTPSALDSMHILVLFEASPKPPVAGDVTTEPGTDPSGIWKVIDV